MLALEVAHSKVDMVEVEENVEEVEMGEAKRVLRERIIMGLGEEDRFKAEDSYLVGSGTGSRGRA